MIISRLGKLSDDDFLVADRRRRSEGHVLTFESPLRKSAKGFRENTPGVGNLMPQHFRYFGSSRVEAEMEGMKT